MDLKKTILFLPLEQYDERYSAQWYEWFMDEFKKAGREVVVIGDTEKRTIKTGQFLDAYETLKYKAQQTHDAIEWLEKNPDINPTIFFMDLWHPGVISLAYCARVAKREMSIKGILHAGTWDPWDHLKLCGLDGFLSGFENSIFHIATTIYVGSHFHAEMIKEATDYENCTVVDFPMIPAKSPSKEERLVVWPHRIAPEKDLDSFRIIEEHFKLKYGDDVSFVVAKDVCKTKAAYYSLLDRAKVVVSTAKQETFGIAMLEGVNSGCWPVVLDSLSYRELYPRNFRYEDISRACMLIKKFLDEENPLPSSLQYHPDLSWIGDV